MKLRLIFLNLRLCVSYNNLDTWFIFKKLHKFSYSYNKSLSFIFFFWVNININWYLCSFYRIWFWKRAFIIKVLNFRFLKLFLFWCQIYFFLNFFFLILWIWIFLKIFNYVLTFLRKRIIWFLIWYFWFLIWYFWFLIWYFWFLNFKFWCIIWYLFWIIWHRWTCV